MFSFLNNSDEEVAFLIDVGNGTVTGAVVVYKKEQKPKFIFVVKKYFSTSEILESKKLSSDMSSLFEETLVLLTTKGFEHRYWKNKSKKVSKIMISFSSPWFLSKTKNIHITNDKEFSITEAFLHDILNNEVTILKNELKSGEGSEDYEVVEKSIVHSKINGYVLDDSIGKTTKTFDASLYLSVVGKEFLNKIHDSVHKITHLGEKHIIVNTFPLVVFTVTRDHFSISPDFVLMDITSEITDLTLVKDDIIEKTVSFPSGKNFIVRQISKALNVSAEIAESTLKLFVAKKLDENMLSKVSEIMSSIEKEWSIYFESALLELSPEVNLPSSVFITSDFDTADIYTDFLRLQKLDATSVFRKNLKITHLDLDKMNSFYENESGFSLDEFIVLISLFYKKVIAK